VRRAGRLDTAGPFAWTRNPVYAAQILLVMPGITICVGIGAMAPDRLQSATSNHRVKLEAETR